LIERLEAHHLRAAVRILQPGESLELAADGAGPRRRAVDRAMTDSRDTGSAGDGRVGASSPPQ